MIEKRIQISRRSFIKHGAVIAAATGLPNWYIQRSFAESVPTTKVVSPNDRPGIALIGCGGKGINDGEQARLFGDILAVCDVDQTHADAAVKKFSDSGKVPKQYADFRKLLERDDVQVILNATPDHWHTLVNLAAANARKDVYGEKPLTLTIDEGKRVVHTVAEKKVIFQTGTQQRSDRRFHLAAELVRNGRLGKLKQVTVWLPAGLRGGPFQSTAAPAELNWDFWQGQTPRVDYIRERCHQTFRFWYDYSGGTMTDWGAHHNDIVLWALGSKGPATIEGRALSTLVPGGYTAFSEYEINFTYADNVRHTVRTTANDSIYGSPVNPDGQHNGIKFEGSDGWLWVNRGEIECSDPELLTTPLPESAERLYKSPDHMGNFFECARSRQAPICEASVGHRSASLCHLGNIALRTGLKLNWDAESEHFTGDNAAAGNAFLSREMRAPYDYSFIA